MTKGESTPLLSPLYPGPPYHYIDAKLFLALFNPPEDTIQALLPAPLRPSQMPLAGLMFGEMPCKEAGPFMETGLLVQCLFDNPETKEEEVGVYFAYNYVNTDVAQSSGREIWGYPRKRADISLKWRGDKITGTAKRNKTLLWKATALMEDAGEWIDSGPNINVKVIPSVAGNGNDLAVLTATYLEYTVKNGRSGEVKFEIQGGSSDNLEPIKIETPFIGLYFDCDIFLPAGKVVAKLDL
ncbi:MAG: acetoacetate decarboxylase family protein [Promethearchaeota archaeon]